MRDAGLTRFMSREGERVRRAETGPVRGTVRGTETTRAGARGARQGDGDESGRRVGRERAGKGSMGRPGRRAPPIPVDAA